jgi:hypothetical protein
MAWSDPVDAYCERLGEGWFAEPLNALSNLAFVLAAWALWALQNRAPRGGLPLNLRLLPHLMLLVGAGSLAFHTLARVWTGWLDSVVILLFCCTFLYAFMLGAARTRRTTAFITALAFAAASIAVSRLDIGAAFNGSATYTPNLVGLFVMTSYVHRRGARVFRSFLLASVTLAIALLMRTIDLALCPQLPLGTHFIWHVLAAFVLWQVSQALVLLTLETVSRQSNELPCHGAE